MSEQPQTYTQEEVQHIVAREVAKQRMADVERQVGTLSAGFTKATAEFNAKIDSLSNVMSDQHRQLREQLKAEQEDIKTWARDKFADQLHTQGELLRLEGKIDKIWLKVSIPVATITTIATAAIQLLVK